MVSKNSYTEGIKIAHGLVERHENFFEKKDSKINAELRLAFAVKKLIESVFLNTINKISLFTSKDKTITGVFKAFATGEEYEFIITDKGIVQYIERTQKNDKNTKKPVITDSFFYYKQDSVRDKCKDGKPCGNTCIAKGKKCNISLPSKLMFALPKIQQSASKLAKGDWKTAAAILAGLFAAKTIKKIAKLNKNNKIYAKNLEKVKELEITKESISALKLRTIVESEENDIKDLDYEKGIVISPKTGEVLVRSNGQQRSVEIKDRDLPLLKGAIFTHNHPWIPSADIEDLGLGFSPQDIQSACVGQLSEIRAVTSGYRHSLKPRSGNFTPDLLEKSLGPTYQKYYDKNLNVLVRKVRTGEMTAGSADQQLAHETVQETAKELGLKYTRIRISEVKISDYSQQRKQRQFLYNAGFGV